MRIQILGVGEEGSPELGNPSFILWDRSKGFLINCGYLVFPLLKSKNLVRLIDKVFISNRLGYNAGSLDSLLSYKKKNLKQKVKFYGISSHLSYLENIDPDFVNNSEEYFNLSEDTITTINTDFKNGVVSEAFFNFGILISGDTSESLLESSYARDARIIFHEVTFESSDSNHTSFEHLARAADEVKRKTWLYQYKEKENQANAAKVRQHGFAGFLEKDQNINM
jgi:ribonuclease BN (tRNA processing enzyme)